MKTIKKMDAYTKAELIVLAFAPLVVGFGGYALSQLIIGAW